MFRKSLLIVFMLFGINNLTFADTESHEVQAAPLKTEVEWILANFKQCKESELRYKEGMYYIPTPEEFLPEGLIEENLILNFHDFAGNLHEVPQTCMRFTIKKIDNQKIAYAEFLDCNSLFSKS